MAKELARRAVCASNQHGIALSANIYASDENGRMPRGNDGRPFRAILLLHRLHRHTAAVFKDYEADPEPQPTPHEMAVLYTDGRGLWQCPSRPIYEKWVSHVFGLQIYTSYLYIGWHEDIEGVGEKFEVPAGESAGQIQDAALQGGDPGVLVADVLGHGDSSQSVGGNHGQKGPGVFGFSVVPGGSNVGRGDGSVAWRDGREILDEYDQGDAIVWQPPPRPDTPYSQYANAYWW